MGSITSQWIVDRLITTPKNDFEQGINSAYITILKQIAPGRVAPQITENEQRLKTAVGDGVFNGLTPVDISELVSFYTTNQKLGFVKKLKDVLGCGLVEGKDIADKLWKL